MNNLVLIGMPTCGKTSVGVLLARTLGLRFLDTDRELEHADGRKLSVILREEGPAGFRALEERTLCGLACDNCVIATGGSAVYCRAGMAHLREMATVIYLRLRYETIRARLRNPQARGVAMAPGQTLEDLYRERSPLYEQAAHLVLDVDGLYPREVIALIREQVEGPGGAAETGNA
jgi:shikimate kinase